MNFRLLFPALWKERAQDLRDTGNDKKLLEGYRELVCRDEIRSEKDH